VGRSDSDRLASREALALVLVLVVVRSFDIDTDIESEGLNETVTFPRCPPLIPEIVFDFPSVADCVAVPGESDGVTNSVVDGSIAADGVIDATSCDMEVLSDDSFEEEASVGVCERVALPFERDRDLEHVGSSDGDSVKEYEKDCLVTDGTFDAVIVNDGVDEGVFDPAVTDRDSVCSLLGDGSVSVTVLDFDCDLSRDGLGESEEERVPSGLAECEGVACVSVFVGDWVTSEVGVKVGVSEPVAVLLRERPSGENDGVQVQESTSVAVLVGVAESVTFVDSEDDGIPVSESVFVDDGRGESLFVTV
jgi:hypothetical protein